MGRNIYNNIRKSVQYLLGCKLGIILSFVLAMLVWQTSPVCAVGLVFIVFVIDMLPAFAVGCGEPTKDIMKSSVKTDEKFFSKGFYYIVGAVGVLSTIATLVAFGIGKSINVETARTLAFAVMAFSHIFASFALSTRLPIWDFRRYRANIWQFVVMIISSGLMVLTLTVPFIQKIFNCVDLGNKWLIAIMLSFIPALVIEIIKIVFINKNKEGK